MTKREHQLAEYLAEQAMSHRPSYREEVARNGAPHDRDGFSGGDWPRGDEQATWHVLSVCVAVLALILVLLAFIGNVCGAELSPSTGKVVEFSRQADVTAYGSGVLVAKSGGTGYVLTAAHVVSCDSRHICFFPRSRGFAYPVHAAHFAPDETVDLCLLEIAAPVDIAPRPIRWSEMTAGDKIWYSGFGNSGQGGPREYSAYVAPRDDYTNASLLLATKFVRHGDSGGPIIDIHGRLVGIISGGDGRAYDKETRRWYPDPHGYHVTLADQAWLKALIPVPEHSILVAP